MRQFPSIPRRCFCGTLIALFGLLLFLPLSQPFTGIPRDTTLMGFRKRTGDFPAWTLRRWQSGTFAAETDAWIREHAGLRGFFVKLNRQLRYSLFGQIAAAPLRSRSLVIGRENFLHENIYLTEALRPPVISPEKIEAFAASLSRLQGLLREQGMAFLVIAAPNKVRLYPDTLPRWAKGQIREDNHDHKAFVEALLRHEVPVLDTMALFRELRTEFPDLVAPHGSHWSFHGAWIALQHAIPLINREQILPPLPVPETEELIWDSPQDMDTELRAQLNLFFGRHTHAIPAAYPVAAAPPRENEQQLDTLIVGDSYGFGLMDALARSHLCRKIDYWFYMGKIYELEPGILDSHSERVLSHGQELGLFRSNDRNGRRFLADKNLVILVLTAFNIDKYSWGFDRMINRLYGDPDDNPPLTPGLPLHPDN